MTCRKSPMIAAAALLSLSLLSLTLAAAHAQGAAVPQAPAPDGVAGDRLVVPLPDLSGLSDAAARDLIQALAQMNVITSDCPGYEVSDPEWQLMTGTTDALMARLGIDAIAYDREYFRPAFSLLDDPASCDRLGPEAAALIAGLEQLGGSTRPSTPGLDGPAPEADAAPAAD